MRTAKPPLNPYPVPQHPSLRLLASGKIRAAQPDLSPYPHLEPTHLRPSHSIRGEVAHLQDAIAESVQET